MTRRAGSRHQRCTGFFVSEERPEGRGLRSGKTRSKATWRGPDQGRTGRSYPTRAAPALGKTCSGVADDFTPEAAGVSRNRSSAAGGGGGLPGRLPKAAEAGEGSHRLPPPGSLWLRRTFTPAGLRLRAAAVCTLAELAKGMETRCARGWLPTRFQ